MNVARKYRIDPDFVIPAPTPAEMFAYSPLVETQEGLLAEVQRTAAWMRKAGATQWRVTIFRDGDGDDYPDGLWFEGWLDPKARQLEFGSSVVRGGVTYPPLVATAKHILAQSTTLGETP